MNVLFRLITKFPIFIIFVAEGIGTGSPDQTTRFKRHLIVDYIRVYQ